MVTVTPSALLLPTFSVPKSSVVGLNVRGAEFVVPNSETNSSAVLASDVISSVPMRTAAAEAFVGRNEIV